MSEASSMFMCSRAEGALKISRLQTFITSFFSSVESGERPRSVGDTFEEQPHQTCFITNSDRIMCVSHAGGPNK